MPRWSRTMLAVTLIATPALARAPADEGSGHRDRLQSALRIAWQRFTLPNGLRVAVHTDRSQPVVRMQTIYRVGSSDEPRGRSGFAHLFEHLMFNGSENAPAPFVSYTDALGADANGVTDRDLTRYFVQTPVAGLERVLFLESDRMGWLAGALTPAKLDQERRIVENEMRQKGIGPETEIEDRATTVLWGADHGYGHPVGGSMADLEAAKTDDARAWYGSHYNPRDATIILVGDIDVATAKRLVTRYFGPIPNRPGPPPVARSIPTLPARVEETMTQPVARPELRRYWAVPGEDSPDIAALIAGTRALSLPDGLLHRALVGDEKLFTDIAVTLTRHRFGSELAVVASPHEGVDPTLAGRRLDAVLAEAFARGPDAAALEAVKTDALATDLQLLRQPDGRAAMLARGLAMADDPDDDLKRTRAILTQTPTSVRAALAKWTARPVYALTVLPGASKQASPWGSGGADVPTMPPESTAPPAPMRTRPLAMPPVGRTVDAVFPSVRRATLSNGIPVAYVHDPSGVFTTLRLSFDAGTVSDPDGAIGLQRLLLALYGATSGIDARTGRIGATLTSDVGEDRSSFTLAVPSVEFGAGAALLADVVQRSHWSDAQIAAARATLAEDSRTPDSGEVAAELIQTHMVDPASPYGRSVAAAQGRAVALLDSAALNRAATRWIRPDKAAMFVVGSLPFDAVRSALDAGFGKWTSVGQAGTRPAHPAEAPAPPSIYLRNDGSNPTLVNILGIQRSPVGADADTAATAVGIAILGGLYGRINTNLRVRHQWSYGIGAALTDRLAHDTLTITGPVQADRVAAALVEIRRELADILGPRPVTEAEVRAAVDQLSREAAAGVAMPNGVLDVLATDARLGRPDDAATSLAARYRAVTRARVEAALRALLRPDAFVWTLTGDVAAIRPQLKAIDLPVHPFPGTK